MFYTLLLIQILVNQIICLKILDPCYGSKIYFAHCFDLDSGSVLDQLSYPFVLPIPTRCNRCWAENASHNMSVHIYEDVRKKVNNNFLTVRSQSFLRYLIFQLDFYSLKWNLIALVLLLIFFNKYRGSVMVVPLGTLLPAIDFIYLF